MTHAEALKKVQYVTDSDGQRTAVLLEIHAWESLLQWMETALDAQAAVKALTEVRTAGGPKKAGWVAWEDVREDWGGEETAG